MQKLFENINSRIRLTPELQSAIQSSFQTELVQKNTLLLKEHQYARKLYFIEKGTLRTFYYHSDKEITSWFYPENQFITAWYSFYNQQPSFEFIEALEASEISWISFDKYQKLFAEFPAFERFGRVLSEEQLSFIDYYSKGSAFMSAKEKYDQLISFFPDIELRVKLGYIASFLGISQETLSRIRSGK